jgi:hypothetical protein
MQFLVLVTTLIKNGTFSIRTGFGRRRKIMGSKIVFFFFCTKKGTLWSFLNRNHTYMYEYIQLVNGYPNHHQKNWGSKNSLFQILGILRVSPEPYVMETLGDACIMIEEAKNNHNICNKSGFTIWLCKLFGPKFHINLNCPIDLRLN